MDFITHLPPSDGKTVIWVVVDRLTKYAHFISLPARFTAASLAVVFSESIYRLHGMPRFIVSDRDRVFISQFWRELFRLSGTTLKFSSPLWRAPPTLRDFVEDETPVAAVEGLVRQRKDILASAKHHLTRARQRMKAQADQHRRDVVLQVGEWVLLRLQPYRQQSLDRRSTQKLSRRYFGPFRILRKIGAVAYELELPAGSQIHPVFHVSLLKPFRGDPPTTTGTLPPEMADAGFSSKPLRVLGQRVESRSGREQILVQWAGQDETDAIWVNSSDFRSAFPTFDLEDKVFSEDGCTDTGMAQEAIQMQPHTLLGPEDSPLQDLDVASNDKVMESPLGDPPGIAQGLLN
ncbi:UNVERIFIED_CONTAM: hypothetical protein Sradi_2973500 [Sesamum radiatum]|uniref:Integrase catalytic domain-containing protein n=1 Tax=Sesamum radiatum TaxID=300843 RepID=A0AAW2S109_SESRA